MVADIMEHHHVHRVLLRESLNASKEPTAGDIFRVNAEFESRVRSVKVRNSN